MYVCGNDGPEARFAVSVGRTAGGSVERNRIKRLAREAFRLNLHKLDCGFDYLLIIKGKTTGRDGNRDQAQKAPICRMSYMEFEALFLELAEEAMRNSRKSV